MLEQNGVGPETARRLTMWHYGPTGDPRTPSRDDREGILAATEARPLAPSDEGLSSVR
ncbi:hypothetical protein GCM10012289_14260 [Nonomuraea cavernae]|uniref:Uncharacterized protein n=1 Tax=Nonomuraea cavernae TaxID=2045107 RepID=A0A918DGD5_9ACTN|nr:hypothetical protein GCM10012289_14260 [Nonomuraea cavernae]